MDWAEEHVGQRSGESMIRKTKLSYWDPHLGISDDYCYLNTPTFEAYYGYEFIYCKKYGFLLNPGECTCEDEECSDHWSFRFHDKLNHSDYYIKGEDLGVPRFEIAECFILGMAKISNDLVAEIKSRKTLNQNPERSE